MRKGKPIFYESVCEKCPHEIRQPDPVTMEIGRQEAAALLDMLDTLHDMRNKMTPEQAKTFEEGMATIGGFMPLQITAGRAQAYTGRPI